MECGEILAIRSKLENTHPKPEIVKDIE